MEWCVVCVHICVCVWLKQLSGAGVGGGVMWVRLCALYVYMHMHECVCLHACMYVCVCAHAYEYTYICAGHLTF